MFSSLSRLAGEASDLKKEIHDLDEGLDKLSSKLFELNRTKFKGTVSISQLGNIPEKIKLLDRRMRIIYNSFEIPDTWEKFSEIHSSYNKSYHGKDVLDADIEYVKAAKVWARRSEYFLDFLIDANLNHIAIEAVTQENLRGLETKYTSDVAFEYKFEILMKLKKIINSNITTIRAKNMENLGPHDVIDYLNQIFPTTRWNEAGWYVDRSLYQQHLLVFAKMLSQLSAQYQPSDDELARFTLARLALDAFLEQDVGNLQASPALDGKNPIAVLREVLANMSAYASTPGGDAGAVGGGGPTVGKPSQSIFGVSPPETELLQPSIITKIRVLPPEAFDKNLLSEFVKEEFGIDDIKVDRVVIERGYEEDVMLQVSFTTSIEKGQSILDWCLKSQKPRPVDQFLETNNAGQVFELLFDNEIVYERLPETKPRTHNFENISESALLSLLKDIDVLIVTTTKVETDTLLGVLEPLEGRASILRGSTKLHTFRIGLLGNYSIAHVKTDMGTGGTHGSTLTVNGAQEIVNAGAIIVVGIAFGIDPSKQRLGDVLVARSVIDYAIGKQNPKTFDPRGVEQQCGTVLKERFHSYHTDWVFRRCRGQVAVKEGLVLCGPMIVNSLDKRNQLADAFPLAIGGEMEGSGAYSAAEYQAATSKRRVEIILVKSICDWADGKKNDLAQLFAASASTDLVKHILSSPDALNQLLPQAGEFVPPQ